MMEIGSFNFELERIILLFEDETKMMKKVARRLEEIFVK